MKKAQKKEQLSNAVSVEVILKSFQKSTAAPLRKVSDLVIKSKADFDHAAVMMKEIKQYEKMAKEKEDSLTEPLTKAVKDIKALFKPFLDKAAAVESDTKAKMLEYMAKTEKQLQQLNEDFENGKIKKVTTVVAKSAELQLGGGAAQLRKTWTAVPIDVSKTPREYLVPDESAIRDALKAGKKVAGWDWKQVDSIAI